MAGQAPLLVGISGTAFSGASPEAARRLAPDATGPTLAAPRAAVHARRRWPTRFCVTLDTTAGPFENSECIDAGAREQMALMGGRVAGFARPHNIVILVH